MRIISGTHKGRSFFPPSNLPVRPTTDFGKEALFNILSNRIDFEQTTALDLFAGSGNITYELCSRGCPAVTAVDMNFHCIKYMQATVESFKFQGVKVVKSEVYKYLKQCTSQYTLIIADPPYSDAETLNLPTLVFSQNILSKGGLLIVEHPASLEFTNTPHFLEKRNYSKVNFSIFQDNSNHLHDNTHLVEGNSNP